MKILLKRGNDTVIDKKVYDEDRPSKIRVRNNPDFEMFNVTLSNGVSFNNEKSNLTHNYNDKTNYNNQNRNYNREKSNTQNRNYNREKSNTQNRNYNDRERFNNKNTKSDRERYNDIQSKFMKNADRKDNVSSEVTNETTVVKENKTIEVPVEITTTKETKTTVENKIDNAILEKYGLTENDFVDDTAKETVSTPVYNGTLPVTKEVVEEATEIIEVKEEVEIKKEVTVKEEINKTEEVMKKYYDEYNDFEHGGVEKISKKSVYDQY